jgi:PIN domain nuclease of toxin-antitoxin system
VGHHGRFAARELERLPPLHRDLFDRMLAAQARAEGMALMTVDPVLARYGVRRV